MEYLEKVMGIQTEYIEMGCLHLPNYIMSRYEIKKAVLEKCPVFLLYPKTEVEEIMVLKKHIAKVQTLEPIPVVLVLKRLTYRQREYLIREKIPFVVEGKQIYLPFLAVYLQERCDAEKMNRDKILPSAQMLLLYFIYQGSGKLSASQAARDLSLTPTSILRATNQLEHMGVIQTKKEGRNKIIFSDRSPKELFEDSKEYLVSPVKRKVYISGDKAGRNLIKSGYTALAEYSMLASPNIKCYASGEISKWDKTGIEHLENSETQIEVELWKYDPRRLSDTQTVDCLSLALEFRDDKDERVEQAVEEMLMKLWRNIDGNRNFQ